jgi:hypothetical protein
MGKCYNSTTVNATCGKVWGILRNFHDMSWAQGVITKVEKVGDIDGSSPGAKRILNEAFHETLLSIDDDLMLLTYSIDDGPGPVAKEAVREYIGTIKVHRVTLDDSSFVEWSSSYQSPDNQAVGDFCNPIYRALLTALSNHCAAT